MGSIARFPTEPVPSEEFLRALDRFAVEERCELARWEERCGTGTLIFVCQDFVNKKVEYEAEVFSMPGLLAEHAEAHLVKHPFAGAGACEFRIVASTTSGLGDEAPLGDGALWCLDSEASNLDHSSECPYTASAAFQAHPHVDTGDDTEKTESDAVSAQSGRVGVADACIPQHIVNTLPWEGSSDASSPEGTFSDGPGAASESDPSDANTLHDVIGTAAGGGDVDLHRSYFDDLPTELCLQIFAYFSHFEVVSMLGQVSLRWLDLAQALIGTKMDFSGDRLAAMVVDDRFIFSLKRFHLTELDISGCTNLSEAGILAAASLGLTVFRARGFTFDTLAALHIFCNFAELKELDLLDSTLPDIRKEEHTAKDMYTLKSKSPLQCQLKEGVTKVQLSCLHHAGVWSSIMQQFPNVQVAVLRDVQNTAALNDLVHLRALRSLVLTKCTVRARGIAEIKTLESLSMDQVYVSGITYLPARPRGTELAEVIEQLPNLRELSLKKVRASGDFEIGDDEVGVLVAASTGLRSLRLETAVSLTDRSLRTIAVKAGPTLRRLELPGNAWITNDGIVQLLEHCRGLTVLSLSACTQLSDVGVEAIARCCPDMTTLNIARCSLVTEQGLFHLADHSALSSIVLYGVHHAMHGGTVRSRLLRRGVAVHYRQNDTDDHAARRTPTQTICTAEYSDSRECECESALCAWCRAPVVECCAADHAEVCRETPVPCSCCGEHVPRSLLAHHYANECEKYIVACPECGVFLPQHRVPRHLDSCALFKARLVPAYEFPGCPLRTSGCLARGRHDHIAACRHYIVRCVCGDEMPRAAYAAHLTMCLAAHQPVRLHISDAMKGGTLRLTRGRYALNHQAAHGHRREGTHYFVNFQGEEVHLQDSSAI
eukprot:m.139632 g.139632  ORF g.139632 m.139632 type:complete len:885 (+) comp22752_c0_seq23:250-2904(+)